MIYGQDVSNFQRSYAWPGGLHFGIAKATEGLTFTDAYFEHNWSALKSKGYVRGAYHFAHTNNGAEAEAKHFLSVVRAHGLEDGDLLALDLEVTDGQSAAHIASWAKTWLTYVKAQTGRTPLLYTFRSFAASNCAGLGGYPLWIADPTTAGKPRLAGPWKDWAIHQYSTAGGIDHDCTRLTVAQLRALGSTNAPLEEDDDMSERISVSASKRITIPADGEWHNLTFDKVDQDSGGAREAKGDLPGIIDHHAWATLTMDGVIANSTPLARIAQVRFAKKDMSKKAAASGYTWREILGTEGGTPISHTRAGMWIGATEHLYAQVKNMTTSPLVISGADVQGTWKKIA